MKKTKQALEWFRKAQRYALSHKLMSALVLIVLLGAGWWTYANLLATDADVTYTLGKVTRGSIISTVTASGQVSASRALDVQPEVSGTITSVAVQPGDAVQRGALIVQIDSSTAQKAVRDAKNNLETAKLSLEKLLQPAAGLTLTQAKNAVSNAEDSLAKSYTDTNTDIDEAYLALPDIMSRVQDIVTGTSVQQSGQWNIDYYLNSISRYDTNAQQYRDDALAAYQKAKISYDAAFKKYKESPVSTTAQTEASAESTLAMLVEVQTMLKNLNSYIQFYENTVTAHTQEPAPSAITALEDLASYIGTINAHVSTVSSDITGIKTGKQNIVEKSEALQDLLGGADALDIRSQQLTVAQREDAVADAVEALAQYSVRAPFAGTVASVDAFPGDEAGSASVATLITDTQVATLSVNEVDAAKIRLGSPASLTFDAIEEVTLTGTVAEIDAVGTVSQGVVSYQVQISFDASDNRIKPGMTVNASIETAKHENVLTVPSSSVKTTEDTAYVLLLNPDQTTQQVTVVTGITDDVLIEIVSGLTEGQEIVVRTSGASTSSGTSNTTTRSGFGGPGIRL
ncbi:MAG: efflux RND transporter periplasmic adaptor subunit [Patescibacteria group bacterium]